MIDRVDVDSSSSPSPQMSWFDATGGDHSLSALLLSGCAALSKLTSTSSKKTVQKHIRTECANIQQHLLEQQRKNQELTRVGAASSIVLETNGDKYFFVLKLACDSGVSKLMVTALDIMQKLVAFGYLDGNSYIDTKLYTDPNPHRQPEKAQQQQQQQKTQQQPLADAAAKNKQAQAASKLLAEGTDVIPDGASSSSATASNGHLSHSSSDVSLAALSHLTPVQAMSLAGSDGRLIAVMIDTLYQCSQYKDQQVQLHVLKCVLTCLTSTSVSVHGWTLLQAVATCYQIYLQNPSHTNSAGEEINRVTAKATLTQIVNLVFQRMEHLALQLKQIHTAQQQQDALQAQQTAAARSPMLASGSATPEPMGSPLPSPSPSASPPPPSSLAPPAPGRRGYCTWCSRPASNYCLQTKDSVCSLECKLANLRAKDPEEKLTQALKKKIIIQLELCQNDAYFLLRALCKLAIKILPAAAGTDKDLVSMIAVDSKILSLQLLLSIVSNAGPTFRTSKHFLATVQGDLVNTLLRNSAASSIETIFALSSSLFVSLVCHFKPHLHAVIGPVLGSIYLPYIASPNSTFEHKYISLTVLHKLCLDPQTLLELFINYDCDVGSLGNTFQMMANTLERVCRSRLVSENWLNALEESRLRMLALEGLVDTIKSLLTWTKRAQANLIASKEASDAAAAAALASLANGSGRSGAAGGDGYDSDPEDTSGGKTPHHARRESFMPAQTPNAADSGAGGAGFSSLNSTTGKDTSSFIMSNFHALRASRQKLDTGILKFNMKPKKGLAYLGAHKILDPDSADQVAQFFLDYASSLDKVQVGEFMGDEHEFNKAVLYAYTEKLEFHGLGFDNAIRKFLQGFWLPGEAQKIDRMMEKFAEQYHKHNPGHFSSADTAYVLAYSVIMLNTDAHSSQVKVRMTREDFFKNTRGIDDGKDVNPAFLNEIYDNITKNEIIMKDEKKSGFAGVSGAGGGSAGMKKNERLQSFISESEHLVAKVGSYLDTYTRKHEQELAAMHGGATNAAAAAAAAASSSSGDASSSTSLSDSSKRRLSQEDESLKVFYQATDYDIEAIRPMFEILWYPSLATFSVLLEEDQGSNRVEHDASINAVERNPNTGAASNVHLRIIELCLDGYRHSIRLSSALGLETSRLAFVTSLRKFTLLGSTREMKLKNIEAIKMLLLISHTEGNHLKDSWSDVLTCISELERLHLFATSRPISDVFQSSPMRTRESDSINSQHVNKIDASSIDRVFTGSAHLDSEAIVDFVQALRTVSEQELSSVSAPRVFSLQKIVEITYYNMGRIRVVWSRIWSVLSAYFCKAGTHPNLNVSMYAIDSLRQLAMKFLEKDELAQFQFQKQFFRPFELIMIHNHSNETRELIVQCMFRMVASRVNNIKSGWKGVFVVIQTAASQTYQPLVAASFELLSSILDHHFQLLTSTTNTMDDVVNGLVAFGCNTFSAISLKAIAYLGMCCDHLGAQQLARREQLAAKQNSQAAQDGSGSNDTSNWPSSSADATPQRSRGASSTLAASESLSISTSIPGSPVVNGQDEGSSEVEQLHLLSPGGGAADGNGVSGGNPNMQQELKIWFLALTGLSRMIGDPRLEVRTRALVTLFKILHRHGGLFSQSTWRAVFHGVLFPIFDDIRHSSDPAARAHAAGGMPFNFAGKVRTAGAAGPAAAAGSEHTTPVGKDDSTPNSVHPHSWSGPSSHAPSQWRNINNWAWPPQGTPRNNLSKPQLQGPSAATVVQPSPVPPVNGIGAAVPGGGAHAVPAPVGVTPRSIPTLPPKPPGSARLPTMPPPTVPAPNRAQAGRGPVPASVAENSWLATTCFSALSTLVELFDHFYSSVSFMLPDLLQLINSCIISQESEDLARIGVKCLVMLLLKSGSKLSVHAWWLAMESIAEILQKTMPIELMSRQLRSILGIAEEQPQQPQHAANTTASLPSPASTTDADDSGSSGSSRSSSRRNSSATNQPVVGAVATAVPEGAEAAAAAAAAPVDASNAVGAGGSLTVNVTAPPVSAAVTSPAQGVPHGPPSSVPPSPSTRSQPSASPAPMFAPSPSPQPPAAVVAGPGALPFHSAHIVTKFKVQLWLLDALFQIMDAHFPPAKQQAESQRRAAAFDAASAASKSDSSVLTPAGASTGQDLDFLSVDGHSGAASSRGDGSTDESVLGCLTCEQLFFGLDLLSSSLNFSRSFNAHLQLRRKLYAFGFQTEQTMQGRLPQLFLQETRATRLYMHLLFRMIREGSANNNGEEQAAGGGSADASGMDGFAWLKYQSEQQSQQLSSDIDSDAAGGAGAGTPVLSSYSSYVRLSEVRLIGLSLRFLSEYISKTVSGQLVSLEHSEELLCSFVDNLHRLSVAAPARFRGYLSIFYMPLVQFIAFATPAIRQHLSLLFQHAMPQLLPMQPIVPFALHKIHATPIPVPAAIHTPNAAAAAASAAVGSTAPSGSE